MKKLVYAAMALAVASGEMAGAASATHSEGAGPKRDSAHGRGHFEGMGPLGPTDVTMQVAASSNASGGGARGRFFIHRLLPRPELHVHGEVTCLNVIGNRATIGGRVVHSKDAAAPPGSGIVIQVEDDPLAVELRGGLLMDHTVRQ